MRIYEGISRGPWMDIKEGEKFYVESDSRADRIEYKLNNNSQFGGADNVRLVKGDFPINEDLSAWLAPSS